MKLYIVLAISLLSSPFLNAQNRHKINVDMADLDSQLSELSKELDNLDIQISTVSLNNTNMQLAFQQTRPTKASISESKNKDIFDQLADTKGVEVVYISKAMLSMMPNMKMPGVNIGNVAGKLESLQIFSSESRSGTIILKREIDKYIKKGDYETLMYVKDEDSKTRFFTKKNQNKQNSEILMITEDNDEITIIRFLGDFSIKDLQNITKSK